MTLDDLINSLFNPANPIYVSLLIVGGLFSIIFMLYRQLINPTISKYKLEKENLELKSAKMMALFAELDPDPLIRINSEGIIIETNQAAKERLMYSDLTGKNIKDILPFINFTSGDSINENHSKLFSQNIRKRDYSILFRSEPSLGIAHIYFHDITDLKTFEKKLIKSQNKLRELSDHLQDLIEQERQSIARGLHDGIGQSLSMLRMKILKMNESDINPEQMENRRSIVETLEDTIRELKNISYNLKPRMLEEMGLGFAIKFLIDKIVNEAGIAGEVNVIGEEIRLESKLEIYLYRIVQEAVTNTIKYSNATNFSVQLMITHKFLRMIISDNGNGFDLEEVNSRNRRAQGMGLINIRERVESYHGHLKIDSSAENGTMIVIEIPLGKEATWQNRDQYVY